MQYQKIKHGEFSYYPGITLISFIMNDLTGLYEILKLLVPAEAYLLLPPSSYHMTLVNIKTVESCGNEYIFNKYLDSLHINKIKNYCVRMPSIPIEIVDWYAGDTFGLSINLNINQYELRANYFDKLECVKTLLPESSYPIRFHMTLGYRNERWLTDQEKITINDILRRYLPKYLTIESPKICYFPDMTSYQEL